MLASNFSAATEVVNPLTNPVTESAEYTPKLPSVCKYSLISIEKSSTT